MLQQHSSVAVRPIGGRRKSPLLVVALLVVAGCGQKGPLTLPEGRSFQRPPLRPVTSPAIPPALSPTDSPAVPPLPAHEAASAPHD